MTNLTLLDLAWIHFLDSVGYAAVALTVVVAILCWMLWHKKVDNKAAQQRAVTAKKIYLDAMYDTEHDHEEHSHFVAWLIWRHAECARFPQFWSIFWWVMWMTAGSLLSMWLYSMHPPCELRNDCTATEAAGIYIGKEH